VHIKKMMQQNYNFLQNSRFIKAVRLKFHLAEPFYIFSKEKNYLLPMSRGMSERKKSQIQIQDAEASFAFAINFYYRYCSEEN